MPRRIALIMAGGGGTRLWPASTADRPKQLLDPLLGADTSSLLQATATRLHTLVEPVDTWVVTTGAQRAGVAAALPDVPPHQILAEPVGRNTAPCIALALRHLRARLGADASATIIALPADHLVTDVPGFRRHLAAACATAETHDRIVTLGIQPDRPDTGYGYIEQRRDPVEERDGLPVFRVARFVEKPDLARAQEFLDAGRFLWNAGIFVMPMGAIEGAFAQHCAATWDALDGITAAPDVDAATRAAYDRIESAPIDIAIMEKLEDLLVLPSSFGWTDLGSWEAVLGVSRLDAGGNAVVSRQGATTVVHDAHDCLVWNEDGTVGVIGLEGVVVIVSRGRVLVCPTDRAQDVREIVARLPPHER